jgi:hypothetical protein
LKENQSRKPPSFVAFNDWTHECDPASLGGYQRRALARDADGKWTNDRRHILLLQGSKARYRSLASLSFISPIIVLLDLTFLNCILTSHSLQQHHPSTPTKPANFDASVTSVISPSPAVLTVQATETCGSGRGNAGNGLQLQSAQRSAAHIAVLPVAKGAQAASDSDFPPLCAPAKSLSSAQSNGIAAKSDAARAAMIKTDERARSIHLEKVLHKRRGDATLFTAPRYAQHVVSIAKWLNLRPRFQDGTPKWLQMRPFPFESEYPIPASTRKCMSSSGLLLQLLQKCFGPARHLTDMVLAQLESRMVKRGKALWRELVIPTEVVFHDPRSSALPDSCQADLAPREAVTAGHGFAYRTMIFPSSWSAETREPPQVCVLHRWPNNMQRLCSVSPQWRTIQRARNTRRIQVALQQLRLQHLFRDIVARASSI